MYAFGRSRSQNMMQRNEDGGRANNNPYAQAIYRRYVMPLAEAIKADLDTKKPGRRKAHTVLLAPMDPEAVAYLAVRNVLNSLMNGQDNMKSEGEGAYGSTPASARAVVTAVGKAAYHELLLGLFAEAEPELFYTLVNDLGRRLSKSERHRLTVFKMQMKAKGVPFPEWGPAGAQQVGAYLVDQLEQLGMVETMMASVAHQRAAAVRNSIGIRLNLETLQLIAEIKDHIVETTPYYLPCVEQPRDWTTISDGGFHTKAMRRMQPYAIRSHGGWSDYEAHDMATPLAAINTLQGVKWRINRKMLETIREVARHFDMEEILSQADFPAPSKPDWLIGDLTVEMMSPEQAQEFAHWKRTKANWFTDMKLRGTRYGRFYTATTVADKFKEHPELFFVYFADFRGRLYAQTTGVSPQGSDMQKALLSFARGKPLDSPDAERWFCIHGANKWGYDKVSLDDRVAWVAERRDLLLGFAADPISNDDWREADSPLQFLAWCFEYAAWQDSPHEFVSRIPIGMDGSCNGLQNFSAMLRDSVGGRATNLVPASKPSDIYQMVADRTQSSLQQFVPLDPPAPDGTEEGDKLVQAAESAITYRVRWLEHGMNRTLVKRSVMTKPYSATRFACADFIVGDYMKLGKVPSFDKKEYSKAAQYLSHFVWDAISEVVVKADEAMTWLQAGARKIIRGGGTDIHWLTPSGFPVYQRYQEQDSHRIRTNLCGNAFLRLSLDNDTPDVVHHRNGIAPNFVHSFDASHLTLVTVQAAACGLDLAMIHDDYGTHAADAGKLYRIIRETFVAMYEGCDPLAELAERYELPAPPARGDLDLRLVLDSPYFFS